jgi:hypothetical protein
MEAHAPSESNATDTTLHISNSAISLAKFRFCFHRDQPWPLPETEGHALSNMISPNLKPQKVSTNITIYLDKW